MPRLYALSYSPWSEKARWALEHHSVNFREVPFLPMLGEPLLRLRMRKLTGRLTVPVLLVDDQAIGDSFEIARYGERVGDGPTLFPEGTAEEIAHWNQLSEQACHAGRALATTRTMQDKAALVEAVPPLVPGPLRRPMGEVGGRFLQQKYNLDERDEAGHRDQARQALEALSYAVGEGPTVLDGFSFADIAMAAALQLIWPVGDHEIQIGRNTRRCFTDEILVQEFSHLGAWRDALYAAHRRRGA